SMTCTVAVTGPDEGGWPAWICTRRALHRAGVQACRITPSNPRPPQPIHGLILGGGADILDASGAGPTPTGIDVADRRWVDTFWSALLAPPLALFRLVGSRLSPSPTEPDANRDALEFDLLMRAEAAGIPVLGICRGAQLMNLARGGSLLFDVQQMYSERPRLRTVFPRRRVFVEPTSRLGYFL